jgi:hypothetical protein
MQARYCLLPIFREILGALPDEPWIWADETSWKLEGSGLPGRATVPPKEGPGSPDRATAPRRRARGARAGRPSQGKTPARAQPRWRRPENWGRRAPRQGQPCVWKRATAQARRRKFRTKNEECEAESLPRSREGPKTGKAFCGGRCRRARFLREASCWCLQDAQGFRPLPPPRRPTGNPLGSLRVRHAGFWGCPRTGPHSFPGSNPPALPESCQPRESEGRPQGGSEARAKAPGRRAKAPSGRTSS